MAYTIDETFQPDVLDSRDYIYSATTTPTLKSVDLRNLCNGVENQLQTGSCVANSSISVLEAILQRGGKFFNLSRLFQYYNLREPYTELKGKDGGAYIRDAFKTINKLGICSEDSWPFDVSKVDIKPTDNCYIEALNHKVMKYERILIDDKMENNIKSVLSKGYPVLFGAYIGESLFYMSGNTIYNGVDRDQVGSHAMSIVGYDDNKKCFIIENSWGSGWGDSGFGYFDYTAFKNDVHDIWVCSAFDGLNFMDMESIVSIEEQKSQTKWQKVKTFIKNNWLLSLGALIIMYNLIIYHIIG